MSDVTYVVMKACRDCGEPKPRTEENFRKLPGGRGWSSVCRVCRFNRPAAVAKRGYMHAEKPASE